MVPKLTSVIFAVSVLWLLSPIVLPLATSFSENPSISFPPQGFTLKWFYDVFSIRDFVEGFKLSFVIGFAASLLTLLVTLPLSYSMARGDVRYKQIWERLFELPIVIPQIVLGFALFLLIVKAMGVTSMIALIAGHMIIISPYTLRNIYSGLAWLNWEIEDAAISLGASKARAFFEVVLPNAKNALLSAFLSAFLISFNAVEISLFLSVAGTVTLPVAMLNFLAMRWDPAISALSSMLVAFTVALVVVSEYILSGGRK